MSINTVDSTGGLNDTLYSQTVHGSSAHLLVRELFRRALLSNSFVELLCRPSIIIDDNYRIISSELYRSVELEPVIVKSS